MSRYDDDPRVTAQPDGSHLVDVRGTEFRIEYQLSLAWTIRPSTELDLDENWVVGYAAADDAIDMLLGKPAEAAAA